MPFYEKGDVRIHYEEAGSGFPLLLIPGGGLNSNISFLTGFAPFNAMEVFKDEYRCITMDLRNANGGQSSGPLEIDRFCRKVSQYGLTLAATISAGQLAMIEFKGSHFERDVILWAVRWYVAYPISYRQLEEMMAEHGVEVDHATLNRWVVKYVPLLEQEFRARKQPVGPSWRMDETYVKVKGTWKYLYRAVDKAGATVDFLLTAKRDRKAALRFLRKAIKGNGTPEKITIDKSGANKAGIDSHNSEHETDIKIRQIKYLNNIVEQDHRAIKRLTRPMLGFKSFRAAAVTLAGIELMHMIRKGQLRTTGEMCPARQFYSLAG